MGNYKVKYRVGARYCRGYWQTEEFDSRIDAIRFRDKKCRDGKDAELIEPAPANKTSIETSRTVEKYVDNLFSKSSNGNLHLF